MRRVIALFCTAFVLLVNGQAQSNRVGAYVKPQGMFVGKKHTPTYGNGFAFSGGAYYEKSFGMNCVSVGVGYTQFNHSFISMFAPTDTTLTEEKVTVKKGLLSLPTIGYSYEFPVTESFLIGFFMDAGFAFRLTEKQTFSGGTLPVRTGLLEGLHYIAGAGINFTYLSTDELGISVIPSFSLLMTTGFDTPTYFGGGGQIRFFYEFGY
jgi:hypothetical protein